MTVTAIIVFLLLVLGSTAVFYAWHTTRPLNAKTLIALGGFIAIFVALIFL